MKKRLFVLAGLALVLAIIGVVSLVTNANKKATCEAFILAVEKGDATSTYASFTDRTKSTLTANQWKKQVSILQVAYGNQPPTASGEPTPIIDSSKTITGYREVYSIRYGDAKYKARCTTLADQPKLVDSFTSEIGY